MTPSNLYTEFYKKIELKNAFERGGRDELEAVKQAQQVRDPKNCLQICKFFDPLIMDNNIDVNESQRLEKPNPIVEKFYAMTREDSVSAAHLRPTLAQQEELDRIAETMDFVAMSAENKFNVWKFRYSQ